MRTSKKSVLATVLCLVVAVATFYGYQCYRALRFFAVEDEITSSYRGVAQALDQYQQVHGKPPVNLRNLVPAYVANLPVLPHVQRVLYTPRSASWQLSVFSDAMGDPRVYVIRSDPDAVEPVSGHLIGDIHGFEVFRLE